MTQAQKNQIIHYLDEFVRLSNSFFEDDNKALHEYWKGQVMGMCKVITELQLENDINPNYYLTKLI